jgi:hypothetical protein
MKTVLLLMLISLLSLGVVKVKLDQATVNLQKMHRVEVFKPMHNKIVMMQPVAYNPETREEAQVAWDQFNAFAKEHNLIALYRHPAEDVWDLALTTDEGTAPKWAVYGFKTLTEAVKQIEADYTKYPNGHDPQK